MLCAYSIGTPKGAGMISGEKHYDPLEGSRGNEPHLGAVSRKRAKIRREHGKIFKKKQGE